jgi:NDP-sugar pyrophosphorylase family protein
MEYYELNNPVFAVQGDNIFDINVKSLINFHKEKCSCLTIVLREVDNVEGLGIADIDKDGRIRRFVEKPDPKDAPSKLANTGLYVLSPEVRKIFKEKGVQQIIKEKNRLDFGYDFIPYIIESGRPVYGYTLKGSWFDVGTQELLCYEATSWRGFSTLQDFGRLSSESTVWVQGDSNDSQKRRQEIIGKIKQKKIEIEGAVLIGRHCEIDDGARIVNSCIDNFTRIGRNAVVANSAVMDRAIIGDNAEVYDSIVGRHVLLIRIVRTNKITVSVIEMRLLKKAAL